MGVGKGNARRRELSAVTTKLRLKQTPMTLFSSQTSDSFHFLNNKAFLWNEVTASICQVELSTKISQELRREPAEGRSPRAWETAGQRWRGASWAPPHQFSWDFASKGAPSELQPAHSRRGQEAEERGRLFLRMDRDRREQETNGCCRVGVQQTITKVSPAQCSAIEEPAREMISMVYASLLIYFLSLLI